MRRLCDGRLAASTKDRAPTRHIRIVTERATCGVIVMRLFTNSADESFVTGTKPS